MSEYVRVPREPTQGMLAAMVMANVEHDKLPAWDSVRRSVRIYKAMLAAAPDQPLTKSGEKLTERLRIEARSLVAYHNTNTTSSVLHIEAADRIAHLERQLAAYQWIPVSERLPESGDLFVIRWNDETEQRVCDRFEVIHDYVLARRADDSGNPVEWACATHWKPLDSPPAIIELEPK